MFASGIRGRTPWIALWTACAAAILAADYSLPNIDLAPLVVVPLLGLVDLFRRSMSIVLAIGLAGVGMVVETVSDHRGDLIAMSLNAAFLACGYIVAILLWSSLRSLIGHSRSLYDQLGALRAVRPRLFAQQGVETLGWRISILDARDAGASHDFHHILVDDRRCELLVGDVLARGLNDVLVLSMVRGAISPAASAEPAERLEVLNERLLHASDEFSSCAAWCAVLDPEGALRLACGGYGPVMVHRGDGQIEILEGGGKPLGMFSGIAFDERMLFMERGEHVLVAGSGLNEAMRSGRLSLHEVLRDPAASAAKLRESSPGTDAFGVIVERCGTGAIEHFAQHVRAEARRRN